MLNKTINKKYKITADIGEGGMSKIYLAKNISNKKKVAIKFLKTDTISEKVEDLLKFRSEVALISKLKHPNIVKILEIGEYQNSQFIVMEYLKGESLSNKISNNKKLKINEALKIIKQICKSLMYIHDSGIIHRDLKPGNILLSNNVKIIDFGLAMIKEFTQIKGEKEIVGTFGYMSPEQSGVVKSEIDHRSDLYSLGIIFYQLLSGKLPYHGKSISNIIHQHISKKPIPLNKENNQIPPILQKIVEKLIEKEPVNRYQTAKGLLSDIKRFEKGERSFNLDLENKSIKLNYRAKFIGNDEELKKLKNLFENTLDKRGSASLISGEAGCGKTRLAEELKKYVYSKGGTFLAGNCYSVESLVPYGPFKNALNIYINIFNRYTERKKNKIRGIIKNKIKNLGEAVLQLNPMLKIIIGETPPLVKLDPEKENTRFLMVVNKFFQALASAEKGLVLKLSDIQWADEGSIEVLDSILDNINQIPLLLLGTYRKNEVNKNGRLSILVNQTIEKTSRSIIQNKYHEINLKYFNKKYTSMFLSDLLHDKENNIQDILSIVYQKSKGNPFITIELIKQLVQESAIFFKRNKWHINHAVLKKTRVSGLIADILLKRINSLNRVQKVILSYSAVIGKKLDMSLLFAILNKPNKSRAHFTMEKIIKSIDEAVSLHLLEKDKQDIGHSLFVHDRIKEAFYKNIKEDKRRQLHFEIAVALEMLNKDKILNDIQNCDILFDLAHHYTEAKDSEKSLYYSYQAGIKSKNNHANEDAIKFFRVANKILVKKGTESIEMKIKCQEHLGEIYLITGNNSKAIKIFNKIIDFMETKIKKANIYRQISSAYFKKGDLKNCEYYGRLALKLLGEKLPKSKAILILSIFKEIIIHLLHSILPKFFLKKHISNQNNIKIQKQNMIIQTYHSLSWSYILTDISRFIRTVIRMLNISESKIGKSKELAMSMGFYAGACMSVPLFKRALRYHNKALNMSNELNDEWGSAQSLQFLGYLYEWKADYHKSIEYFKKCMNIFKKIGDIKETAMSQNGLLSNYYNLADYRNALNIGSEYLEYCIKIEDKFGILDSYNNFSKCYIALGDFTTAEKYAKQALKMKNEKSMSLNYCISNTYLGVVNIKRNKIDLALKFLNRAKTIYENNKLIQQYSVFIYFYLAQAYIKKYRHSSNSELLLKNIKKICNTALRKSKSWPTHYPIALRTKANYLSLINKNKKAENLFQLSIILCQERNLKYELAKSLYYYGLFLKKKERGVDSRFQLEHAYMLFEEIDSKFYIKKTAALLGINEDKTNAIDRLKDKQKLISLINVSQDISSILDLNILLKQIIFKAIEVTGAQRGFIFIVNDKSKKLEIKASSLKKNNREYSTSIVDRVFNTHQTIITTNAELESQYNHFISIAEFGLKSILCMPIKHHDKLIGIFYLDNTLSSGVFSEEDLELLNVYMAQAAIAIENAKAYHEIDNLNKNLELEILGHKQTAKELLVARDQLAERVDVLEGFLPICSFCKKIRDDGGKWNNMENYITKRSKAKFSHGLCPDCLKEHYPEHSDLC